MKLTISSARQIEWGLISLIKQGFNLVDTKTNSSSVNRTLPN